MIRRGALRSTTCLVVAVALSLAAGLATGLAGEPAAAQDGASTTTSSTVAELPPAEMIPRPNSGHEPTDAGDRGGALQLLVLAVVLLGLGAGVAKVVHDSRQARRTGPAGERD